jgi:hypothetical protein
LAPGGKHHACGVMHLFNYLVILDYDISQHSVESDPRFDLELLRALVDHRKNFRDKLLLCIQITLED